MNCWSARYKRRKVLARVRSGVCSLALLLGACASQPPSPEEAGLPSIAEHIVDAGLVDERGQFRELFCASLEEHGQELYGYRPCDQALIADPREPLGSGKVPPLDYSQGNYVTLVVPGLGWECLAEWLDKNSGDYTHVRRFGFDVRLVEVDGLSSSENNARQIRDYIVALPEADAERELILLGYSKGAPDALTALANYPEVAERVVAMVSVAGAVKGSPLADDAKQSDANLLTWVPGSDCGKGDEGAVASLRTVGRQAFLAENALPSHIAYYSIVASPNPERVSRGLRMTYNVLSEIDPRNDSQLLFYDQMIPGSTLLALLDADHWAVAVPLAESHEFVAGILLIDQNKYPRDTLLEATLRYVESDLANSDNAHQTAK